MAQEQTELRPAGEHAIRLGRAARDQIIDEHADVTLGAFHVERGLGVQLERRIGAGNQTLRCRFLVARSPVDLPGQIKTGHGFGFQGRMELGRRTIIILDRITRPEDMGIFQSEHGPDEGQLHLEWQACRNTVHIIFASLPTLGFEEKLVAVLVGEADHLVFDGRTIPRPDALDDPGIHG